MAVHDALVVHSNSSAYLRDERRYISACGNLVSERKSTDIKLGGWCPTCHSNHGKFTWLDKPMSWCEVCGVGSDGKSSMLQYALNLLKSH